MRTAPGSCIIEGEKGGQPKIQVEIKSPLTECPVSERPSSPSRGYYSCLSQAMASCPALPLPILEALPCCSLCSSFWSCLCSLVSDFTWYRQISSSLCSLWLSLASACFALFLSRSKCICSGPLTICLSILFMI